MKLSQQGYELMDKKRNILIRELTKYIEQAKVIQNTIDEAYKTAYAALQQANIRMGIDNVQMVSRTVSVDESIDVRLRSVMGTEIPLVRWSEEEDGKPVYSFYSTHDSLDEAKAAFLRVKKLTLELAQVEIAAYRLAAGVQKTQKRANALQNITIPHYEALAKSIQNALEEKEREEFTRLKVIKRMKTK